MGLLGSQGSVIGSVGLRHVEPSFAILMGCTQADLPPGSYYRLNPPYRDFRAARAAKLVMQTCDEKSEPSPWLMTLLWMFLNNQVFTLPYTHR